MKCSQRLPHGSPDLDRMLRVLYDTMQLDPGNSSCGVSSGFAGLCCSSSPRKGGMTSAVLILWVSPVYGPPVDICKAPHDKQMLVATEHGRAKPLTLLERSMQ